MDIGMDFGCLDLVTLGTLVDFLVTLEYPYLYLAVASVQSDADSCYSRKLDLDLLGHELDYLNCHLTLSYSPGLG